MEFSRSDMDFIRDNRYRRYREVYPTHTEWHFIKGAYTHSRSRLHVKVFAYKYQELLKRILYDEDQ